MASHYTSHPAGPFVHIDAVKYLRETYGIPARDAADLLQRATERPTGMASYPRRKPYQRTVWVTHMTTQGGKFMVEVE